MKFSTSALLAFALSYQYASVEATYTVAGADLETGLMGAAGVTCVLPTSSSLYHVNYHPVAGKGLLLSQAKVADGNSPAVIKAKEMMAAGEDCSDILDAITTTSLDSEGDQRQYACVDLQGNADAYTGSGIEALYDRMVQFTGDVLQPHAQVDHSGSTDSLVYSAQGNGVSLNTVPLLTSGLEDSEGCDLADKLFRSIIAVDDANTIAQLANANDSTNFEGDVRCENGMGFTPGYGYPGLQAYIHVDDKDGKTLLHIQSLPKEGVNPYDDLRAQYALWRQSHPCPVAECQTWLECVKQLFLP